MKRSGPIRRTTSLKRGAPLGRKKKKLTPEEREVRRAKNRAKRKREKRRRTDPETGWQHTYGPYHQWLKGKHCEVWTHGNGHPCVPHPSGAQRTNSMPHHRKSIGAGGQDYGNELPLCWGHHVMIETEGEADFELKTGVNPKEACERWRKEWDRTHPAPRSSMDPDQS